MVPKGLMRRAIPPSLKIESKAVRSMSAATAASPASPPMAEGRSPFVRLHELLADIKPGQPPINLSVGEPQHPIPPFVGSVLQAHGEQLPASLIHENLTTEDSEAHRVLDSCFSE